LSGAASARPEQPSRVARCRCAGDRLAGGCPWGQRSGAGPETIPPAASYPRDQWRWTPSVEGAIGMHVRAASDQPHRADSGRHGHCPHRRWWRGLQRASGVRVGRSPVDSREPSSCVTATSQGSVPLRAAGRNSGCHGGVPLPHSRPGRGTCWARRVLRSRAHGAYDSHRPFRRHRDPSAIPARPGIPSLGSA
jgi:hypothetical protein